MKRIDDPIEINMFISNYFDKLNMIKSFMFDGNLSSAERLLKEINQMDIESLRDLAMISLIRSFNGMCSEYNFTVDPRTKTFESFLDDRREEAIMIYSSLGEVMKDIMKDDPDFEENDDNE